MTINANRGPFSRGKRRRRSPRRVCNPRAKPTALICSLIQGHDLCIGKEPNSLPRWLRTFRGLVGSRLLARGGPALSLMATSCSPMTAVTAFRAGMTKGLAILVFVRAWAIARARTKLVVPADLLALAVFPPRVVPLPLRARHRLTIRSRLRPTIPRQRSPDRSGAAVSGIIPAVRSTTTTTLGTTICRVTGRAEVLEVHRGPSCIRHHLLRCNNKIQSRSH